MVLAEYLASPSGSDGLRETWWDNDYSPKANGPLVDAGTGSGIPSSSTDLAGNPRVNGSAIDIGAYEFTVAQFFNLEILEGVGGTTSPSGIAVAGPANGHKIQVNAFVNPMWSFDHWDYDPFKVMVDNPRSPSAMVTLLADASIQPVFRKTTTLDDRALKVPDLVGDDGNPSCEFLGSAHWDFSHASILNDGAKRLQMVLEAAPFQTFHGTDGGVRVYLDVMPQAGSNVFDYRFKIRSRPGGGWFVTREKWETTGLTSRWVFDGDSRVDGTIGEVASNPLIAVSLNGPFTSGTRVLPGGLFELAFGLPVAVTSPSVGIWIEGAGDEIRSASAPVAYPWSGSGASLTIDGNLEDWVVPVPGANP